MRYSTYQQIKALHPCSDQLRKAHRLFGKRKRMRVTVDRAIALACEFDFEWLAERTLTGAARQAYEQARAAVWQVYKQAEAPARQAYERVRAAAWQAHEQAIAAARKSYEQAVAAAWARCYLSQ